MAKITDGTYPPATTLDADDIALVVEDGTVRRADQATMQAWLSGGGTGITDGNKGDITVTGSGATWTINPNTVNAAKAAADVATQAELDAHINDTVDAHDATAISYAGGTGMSATTVEAAIDELATEKADTSSLGALAGMSTVSIAVLPAGSTIVNKQASGGTWPARPTARTDIMVIYLGYPDLTSMPSDQAADDVYWKRVS